MRYLYKILGFCLFLAALGFALKNTQLVTLDYYLGIHWNAPLALVLLIVFCAGVLAGIMAGLPMVIKQRRRFLVMQRELQSLQSRSD